MTAAGGVPFRVTLTVDASKTSYTHGTVELTKGTRYEIEVTGGFTEGTSDGGTLNYDALCCYGGALKNSTQPQCQPPQRNPNFYVGVGSKIGYVDGFQSPGGSDNQLPYSASHKYTAAFYAPADGTLAAGGPSAGCGCTIGAGTVTVKIYGSSAAPTETVKFGVSAARRTTPRHHHAAYVETTVNAVCKLVIPTPVSGIGEHSDRASGTIRFSELRLGGPKVIEIDEFTARVTGGTFVPGHGPPYPRGPEIDHLTFVLTKSAVDSCPAGKPGSALLQDNTSADRPDVLTIFVEGCGVDASFGEGETGTKAAVVIQEQKPAPA